MPIVPAHDFELRIRRVNPDARQPRYANDFAAGLDFFPPSTQPNFAIPPGETFSIPLGWALEIPPSLMGIIWPRSGLALRNSAGVLGGLIDPDYRGELTLLLHNHRGAYGREAYYERVIHLDSTKPICQLIFLPRLRAHIEEVKSLGETARAAGGFGSTDNPVNYADTYRLSCDNCPD